MSYLTRAEYIAYISALVSSSPVNYATAEESMLDTLIAQAQEFIEKKTGRRFEANTETRLYGASAQVYHDPKLLLVDEDLLTVTTLTNGNGEAIGAGSYWPWPLNNSPHFGIRLKSAVSWTFGGDEVVSVAGTWGHMATASPLIKRLTARVTRHMEQTRSATGTVTIFGDGVRSFEAALPADVRDQLAMLTRRMGNH